MTQEQVKAQPKSMEWKYRLIEGSAPVLGFLFAMVVMMVTVQFIGESPIKALSAILTFSFSQAGVAYIVSQSIPSWKKRETDSLRKRQEICIAIAMTSERSRHGILLSTILKSAVMRAKMLQMP